jgi:hydroxymethylbilane synthase
VNRTLRIGTRGSELALWQAHHVAGLLSRLEGAPGHLQIEILEIRTEGDHVLDRPLSEVPGKAFFTKEIEEALAAGHVDLAVHSLKDLPTELPPGLALAAVLEREDPRDVWIAAGGTAGAGFAALPAGGKVGTSSLRRRALLARYRPDLELVDLRGNVPTRVRRVEEGKYDAIILAAAGVKRLGLERHITEYLPLDRFLPAVAQGAVAVEIRAQDDLTRDWVRRLNHPPTHLATAAERALLATLEGGCQVPVGALATLAGEELRLTAEVVALDGRRFVTARRSGPASRPEELGRALAEELIAAGAAAILAGIRSAGAKP